MCILLPGAHVDPGGLPLRPDDLHRERIVRVHRNPAELRPPQVRRVAAAYLRAPIQLNVGNSGDPVKHYDVQLSTAGTHFKSHVTGAATDFLIQDNVT